MNSVPVTIAFDDTDDEFGSALKLKKFIRVGSLITHKTKEEAELMAQSIKDNRLYTRSVTGYDEPMPPEIETTITKDENGNFAVWYRDRT